MWTGVLPECISVLCHTQSVAPHEEGERQHLWVPKVLIVHHTDRSGLQGEDLGASDSPEQGLYKRKHHKFVARLQLQFSPIRSQRVGTFLVCSITVNGHKMELSSPTNQILVLSVVRSSHSILKN